MFNYFVVKWSSQGLHAVSKALAKHQTGSEERQKQSLLTKAEALGLRSMEPPTPISTVEEWSAQNLLMENDQSIVRKKVVETLEKSDQTVSVIKFTLWICSIPFSEACWNQTYHNFCHISFGLIITSWHFDILWKFLFINIPLRHGTAIPLICYLSLFTFALWMCKLYIVILVLRAYLIIIYEFASCILFLYYIILYRIINYHIWSKCF